MKEFVESPKWEGKTIERIYGDEDEIIVSFTDGTYGRVCAEYEGEDAAIIEEECFTSSVYVCRRVHAIGIITDEELSEAERRHAENIKNAADQQRYYDMQELKRLLDKYPDMKGDNQ